MSVALPWGEEKTTVGIGEAGMKVFEGCVRKLEGVIDDLWVPFAGGLLLTSISGPRLGLTVSLTPTMLPFLSIKSSYEGPASPLSMLCGWERCRSRRPNSMSVSVWGELTQDSSKKMVGGMTGLSDIETYFSTSYKLFQLCSERGKRHLHPSQIPGKWLPPKLQKQLMQRLLLRKELTLMYAHIIHR